MNSTSFMSSPLGFAPRESVTPLDAINWTTVKVGPVVNVWFAPAYEAPNGDPAETTLAWAGAAKASVEASLQATSNVANITFNIVQDAAQANWAFFLSPTMPSDNSEDESLGFFQNTRSEIDYGGAKYTFDGYGIFNASASSWTDAGLQMGGSAFTTVLHEIGHGLGLSHPHDDSGEENDPNPPATIMRGVTGAFGSYGDNELNQSVYTVMSYNDGWQTSPAGPLTDVVAYGANGGFGALDIAVLQAKYGANTGFAAGDNVYNLPASDGDGTFYMSIWDTGGVDTISAARASAGAIIDLRAATLDYSDTGGGVVSYVTGVHGGVTIANGVVIENVIGGQGDDKITGNAANNVIAGDTGNDTIDGGAGRDTSLYGQSRASAGVTVENGTVTVAAQGGTDTLVNVERLQFTDEGLAFDTGAGENAGVVFRTYQAAFNRAPDEPGMGVWIKAADQGMSFEQIAAGFLRSSEFETAYGANPTSETYVSKLYENILGRAGEQSGIDFWQTKLAEGATQAMVLYTFAESSENIDRTAASVVNGVIYDLVSDALVA
ncbi:Metallo-peptidase family M12B Reprolysin-like [Fulvimarina manganoxydans]|uniref:Metallo-peptidase family M12B Reprolysin-like n=1 Tax=Fulvimarina manganoxydans TaxID=937218 RepID=A0A1W2DZ96_9HYPH|nr:DUF4214 domain-containing protein [Fulvimarina manganoxydans]SMD02749.1 Metallo-peptidase family M12B Reprolysin-like [Fulvimarina manganoxydans]